MNLFYAPPEQVTGKRIRLSGQEARHAAKVLRLGEGDPLAVADGRGRLYQGNVRSVGRGELIAEWDRREERPPPDPACTLALGLLKKRDRMEFAVEKAVELGAVSVALYRSRHSVKKNVRMERMEAAALAAMKQSLRAWLPEIRLFDSFGELLETYPGHRPVMAHPEGARRPENLGTGEGEKFLLLVGPEGDFSEEELQMAADRGAERVSLGAYRLRSETAALALLSRMLREG